MKNFNLGKLSIDPIQYGSQGNAILGIRDSGKSYTATYFAERLFDVDIPFVAFDPIGIWRFLRVPSSHKNGKGYPVVVAGGKEGDLPLTENGAPEIVRAAMRGGVSLVIDLFDINLSKSAWRRIVKDCVLTLLHENQQFGLRHVFLEEAAEFIPQKPNDWDVYNAIEKLARMGGNSRLGYTLINQRSQEVSKAILELCENIFLHRQRGKNALENLDKWLTVAGADERKAILQSLPDLPQGDCWAWLGGDTPKPPTRVHVPPKRSAHPDRRVMRGDTAEKPRGAVDVGKFVDAMKSTLTSVEQTAKANDPKLLKAQIAKLEREIAAAKQGDADAAFGQGLEAGVAKGHQEANQEFSRVLNGAIETTKNHQKMVTDFLILLLHQEKMIGTKISESGRTAVAQIPAGAPRRAPVASPARAKPTPVSGGVGSPNPATPSDLPRPLQSILDAIKWWNAFGLSEPSVHQVAFIAGYAPGSGTWNRYLSDLRTRDLIERRGALALTAEGARVARPPDVIPSGEALREAVMDKIDAPLRKILQPLLNAYPNGMSDAECGDVAGYQPGSGTWNRYLSALRSISLIEKKKPLTAQGWLFP